MDEFYDPNLSTLELIGEWIETSPVCQAICTDAREGCQDSEAFIKNMSLRMDSAMFFMGRDDYRVDKELSTLVRIIEGLN
jgi:hypothetical protein